MKVDFKFLLDGWLRDKVENMGWVWVLDKGERLRTAIEHVIKALEWGGGLEQTMKTQRSGFLVSSRALTNHIAI